jgi:hypothetical protein
LGGVIEGQKSGIVVERYGVNPEKTDIQSSISLLRLLGILALVIVVASLITFATRIRSTTTIGKKITEEIAEAEKKLALLKKTAGPMPLASWIIIIVGVVLLVFGLWALCYGLSTGPPFGW